jgi:hypothetical protein
METISGRPESNVITVMMTTDNISANVRCCARPITLLAFAVDLHSRAHCLPCHHYRSLNRTRNTLRHDPDGHRAPCVYRDVLGVAEKVKCTTRSECSWQMIFQPVEKLLHRSNRWTFRWSECSLYVCTEQIERDVAADTYAYKMNCVWKRVNGTTGTTVTHTLRNRFTVSESLCGMFPANV